MLNIWCQKNSESNYIGVIKKIIEQENIGFVHIQPDVEVSFWSKNRGELKEKLLLPSEKAIEACHDKMYCNALLKSKGIPAPDSYHVKDKKSIGEALNNLKSKNEKIWVRAIRGAGSRASLPVKEIEHAESWIDYWNKNKGTSYQDFMLAEFLPGKEYAFQSIWKNGELVTSQARERKEYVFGNLTPSGQSSSPSVAVSVHNEKVNEIATKAILAIDENASGVFCVDLKENKEGTPCVTEINIGRFFTTSDFFSKAGSNMPYYYIKMAYNEKLPFLKKYDSVDSGLHWLRIIDMGKKLVKEGEWSYKDMRDV